MKHLILILIFISVFTTTSICQKRLKPAEEWSRKDAEKILNDSPWGTTQTEVDISEMFFRLPTAPSARSGSATPESTPDDRAGASNQATSVMYRIRFLSAKPIREAIARLIELDQPSLDNRVRAYMKDFVGRSFDRWIAVTVTVESRDQRYLNQAGQILNSAVTDVLKNTTYLERKDGKRLFLHMYQPPSPDGLGAKFIFVRAVDGRPFLDESDEVRFVSELTKTLKLDRTFKISEMVYDGKLEY